MSFKNIVRELRELKDGIGSRSRRGEGSNWRVRTRSHVVPDQTPNECVNVEQSPWANLPPELLLDIIQRVEESEATWPARAAVVCCAAVCRSWREITKEVVQNPEKCGRFTFPISLKQPGPRDSPIQCYIRRDRATSTYLLFYGLAPYKLRTTLYALDEITKKIPSSGDQKLLFFASFSAFRSAKLGIFFVISSSAYNVVIDLSVSSRPTLLSGQSSLKKKGYLRCSSLYVGMVYKLSISMLCSVAIFGSEDHSDKLLLASRKTRRATCTDFVISLSTENFSRASDKYVGKLRSNFLGTKFTVYDSQPPSDSAAIQCARPSRRFHSRQVLPRVPACNYSIGTITYELNVLRTRGPRKMHCVMHSIPVSSIQEGGSVPTPSSFMHSYEQLFSPVAHVKVKESVTAPCSPSIPATPIVTTGLGEPLNLKNKSPRWHEQLQCWCLNFRGRVTVASVKNFQLVAEVDASHNVTPEEQERVILQFGKIGKDIFTMDYRYPLSAFQAFAICLSSFDTKPACE